MLMIFAALFFVSQVMAQDAYVRSEATNFNISLDAGDTVSATGTVTKTVGLGAKHAVQLYLIQVDLDSVSGTPTQTAILSGSMDNSAYVNIDTVSWAGTTSDTTFYFTDISTGVAWPYMRVVAAESSTGKSLMTKLIGRFLDEVR